MKNPKRSRLLTVVLMVLLFALAPFGAKSAQAAQKTVTVPPAVRVSTKIKSETKVEVRWTKAKGASGYLLIEKQVKNGKTTIKQTTTSGRKLKRSYEEGIHYYYQVRAYKRSGKKKIYSVVSNTAELYIPKTVSSLIVKKYEDDSAILQWEPLDDAVGYRVYLYNPAGSKKYEAVGDTQDTWYKLTGLTKGITYQAVIRPIQKSGSGSALGASSNIAKIKISPVLIPTVHGRYWKATVKTNTTATVIGSGKKVTLKKGTALITASRSKNTVAARISGNPDDSTALLVNVSGRALSFGSLAITSPKYIYTTEQNESFVNAKGLSSKTDWLVVINQFTCTVTVFKGRQGNWTQMRSISCVVGEHGRTPTGKFRIIKKSGSKTWFTWSSALDGGNAFHGYVDRHRRGAHSHGCVRMSGSDCSYIARNVPTGSTVFSF